MLGPCTTIAWATKTLINRATRAAGVAVLTTFLRARNKKHLALDARLDFAFAGFQRAGSAKGSTVWIFLLKTHPHERANPSQVGWIIFFDRSTEGQEIRFFLPENHWPLESTL